MADHTFMDSTPWGRNGVDFKEKYLSVEEVMVKAGLKFNVGLEDAFLADGTRIPKTKITRRDDLEGEKSVLGVVGDRFTVLQNTEALGWFQSFIDAKAASITTAGTFKGGRVVFIQAEVSVDPVNITKNATVKSYITLGHGHDGSLAVFAGFTPVNIFCTNQFPMLKRSKTSKLLKMKHTKGLQITLATVKEIMEIATGEFHATCDQYKFLASKVCNPERLQELVKLVLEPKKADEGAQVRDNVIEKIEYMYEHGRGIEANTPHTMFRAFNAVNEYLNYEKGRIADQRLHALWFGENAALNQKALDVAMQQAQKM